VCPRRDAGRPRGEPVEQAILKAALRELAEHGLAGLSLPRIAQAADVNKTSLYRRWPTREDLVKAALQAALHETAAEVVDTGTLAGDLRHLLRSIADRLGTPAGRALAVAAMSESMSSSVQALRREQLHDPSDGVRILVERAAARGEWDVARCPPEAVFSMLTGSVFHRALMEHQEVTEAWIDAVVGVVVVGVRPG
jgi:AcrR family transcriptional regulator